MVFYNFTADCAYCCYRESARIIKYHRGTDSDYHMFRCHERVIIDIVDLGDSDSVTFTFTTAVYTDLIILRHCPRVCVKSVKNFEFYLKKNQYIR